MPSGALSSSPSSCSWSGQWSRAGPETIRAITTPSLPAPTASTDPAESGEPSDRQVCAASRGEPGRRYKVLGTRRRTRVRVIIVAAVLVVAAAVWLGAKAQRSAGEAGAPTQRGGAGR